MKIAIVDDEKKWHHIVKRETNIFCIAKLYIKRHRNSVLFLNYKNIIIFFAKKLNKVGTKAIFKGF